MTNIRRSKFPGQSYFTTHVTYQRSPILLESFDVFWKSIESVRTEMPFDLIAWVVLPDHCHMLINPRTNDLSEIIRLVKLRFSGRYRSALRLRKGRLWQYRFWDHVIRDREDLYKHLNYIHHNPVKHGLAQNPIEYEFSSFRNFVEHGYYSRDWGADFDVDSDDEFGE